MKIYIAAPYAARALVEQRLVDVERIGYTPTCRWATDEQHGSEGLAGEETIEERVRFGNDDLADIRACDVFVVLTAKEALPTMHNEERLRRGTSGGRHIETGVALQAGKRVMLVGEPENVFHWQPQITRRSTWHDAILDLAGDLVQRERGLGRVTPNIPTRNEVF